MYKILVTTDGSEQSKKTIDETIKIAAPMGKEVEVVVLFVMQNIDSIIFAPDLDGKLQKEITHTQDVYAVETVEKMAKVISAKGIKTSSKVLKGHPVDQICSFAEKEKCNLIVMGKRSRGKLEEFIAGSVSVQVVHRAKTNVMVIK